VRRPRSSFAEKAVRKFDKYPDAVNQMTDLCGARVIIQTIDQVLAVRKFIEDNFEIVEKEGKGPLLSTNTFDYRDMHFQEFTDPEVELMAEMEHARWNVERLRNGWRYGKERDNDRKIHNCLVSWNDLAERIKHYDRETVRAFPAILAKAGLEVRRR